MVECSGNESKKYTGITDSIMLEQCSEERNKETGSFYVATEGFAGWSKTEQGVPNV